MTERPGQVQDYITAIYGVRARQALIDLRTFIALGEGLAAQGRTAYDGNIYLRLSAEAIVHRVGEAAARLPATLVQTHPEIEFSLAEMPVLRLSQRPRPRSRPRRPSQPTLASWPRRWPDSTGAGGLPMSTTTPGLF